MQISDLPSKITLEFNVLIRFADRLSKSVFQRHLFFLACTVFTILFVGYLFGTGDQVIHLPFIRKELDPTLYPDDTFVEMRHQHYTYFWRLFFPLARLGLLEVSMFVVYVLVVYAAFWALWILAEELFHNPLTNVLSVAALAFPHVGFAGWPAFEFSLLPRTFVFPFLLITIILYLRRRYLLAFALAGVLYNLHVVSVNFLLAMFLFNALVQWRAVGWRNVLAGLALFGLCALPVLLWRSSQASLDLSLRPEWLSIVARGTLNNLFFLFAPYPYIILPTLSGLGMLALFAIAHRAYPSPTHGRTILYFMGAVVLILLVAVITAHWLPITLIIQSQIVRVGVFAIVFGYLYFAHYLAREYQAGRLVGWDFGLLTAALIGTVIAIVPLMAWAIQRWIKPRLARRTLSVALQAGMLALTLGLAFQFDLWRPGLQIFAPRTPFVEAQVWARDNTPKETLFIVPPEKWWIYETDWRVFSERATTPQLSDLLMVAFVPQYLEIWTPGFEQVAPGAAAQYQGDLFANWGMGAKAYYGLSNSALLQIARDWHADYLVVDKTQSPARPWPVAYENSQYLIYNLRSAKQ